MPVPSSSARRALRVDVERIERLAGRHEEAVPLAGAEAEIGAALGQGDAADRRPGGREDHHPVEALLAHAPAGPEIAVDIAAEAVGGARTGIDEDAALGELPAVGDDVVDADEPRHGAGFDDVHLLLVRREAEAVGPVDVAGDDGRAPGLAVDPVDVGRQLGRRRMSLVIAEDAEGRVGEPDRIVRLDDDVVGRVERLAVIAVAQDGDAAVILGAGDAPCVVLAGDEPALAVAGVAGWLVPGPSEDADRASLLLPLHHPVVRDVAPQEIAAVAEPYRPLAPAKAGRQTLDRGEGQAIFGEARIQDLNRRIRVSLARLPHGFPLDFASVQSPPPLRGRARVEGKRDAHQDSCAALSRKLACASLLPRRRARCDTMQAAALPPTLTSPSRGEGL